MDRVELTSKETRPISAIDYCDICGEKTTELYRTYFRYEKVKCKCHSPYHFDVVHHCKDCKLKTPETTVIEMDHECWFTGSEIRPYKVYQNREEKLNRILK